MEAQQVLVVGSINRDSVHRLGEFPQPGETVVCTDVFSNAGGKGANQAVAVARCGGRVKMAGCVGNDAAGDEYVRYLKAEGVGIEATRVVEGARTGSATILVNGAGENMIAIDPGANGRFEPAMLDAVDDGLNRDSLVLLQNEIPLETTLTAIERAKGRHARVVWNPAPAAGIERSMLAGVDFLIPNESEAESLCGLAVDSGTDADRAARMLHDAGVGVVLITMGRRGVWLSRRDDGGTLIPAFRVQAVDTTAAGDTFAGAFVAALSRGAPPEKAAVFGQAAAALSVTRNGAQASIPSRQDVERFLDTRRHRQTETA
jgi:ribokinase